MMSHWELRRERIWDLAFVKSLEWDGVQSLTFKAQLRADKTAASWEHLNPRPVGLLARFMDWVGGL